MEVQSHSLTGIWYWKQVWRSRLSQPPLKAREGQPRLAGDKQLRNSCCRRLWGWCPLGWGDPQPQRRTEGWPELGGCEGASEPQNQWWVRRRPRGTDRHQQNSQLQWACNPKAKGQMIGLQNQHQSINLLQIKLILPDILADTNFKKNFFKEKLLWQTKYVYRRTTQNCWKGKIELFK